MPAFARSTMRLATNVFSHYVHESLDVTGYGFFEFFYGWILFFVKRESSRYTSPSTSLAFSTTLAYPFGRIEDAAARVRGLTG